jgi:hypothetical protein
MYNIVQSENIIFLLSFLANWKLYPIPMTVNLLKGLPPTHTIKWRKYERRGGFYAQYRGNVLLWPKSDESKKSLVLFYLFTLWAEERRPRLIEDRPQQRKFIDWKKTKLFRLRWNWDEEKKFCGIRLQISSPPPFSLRGGGKVRIL